jgi:hypothetical protein
MPASLPRRTYLQSKFRITPLKTITLTAGNVTLHVLSLVAGIVYRSINFVINDYDATGATSIIRVFANSAADGSGTDIEIYTSAAIPAALNQTCVIEIDAAYIASVCDLQSGGFIPKSIVVRMTGATNTDTLAFCSIHETMEERIGLTPSSISMG